MLPFRFQIDWWSESLYFKLYLCYSVICKVDQKWDLFRKNQHITCYFLILRYLKYVNCILLLCGPGGCISLSPLPSVWQWLNQQLFSFSALQVVEEVALQVSPSWAQRVTAVRHRIGQAMMAWEGMFAFLAGMTGMAPSIHLSSPQKHDQMVPKEATGRPQR